MSVGDTPQRILLVCERDFDASSLSIQDYSRLDYRFEEPVALDGLRAWRDSEGEVVVDDGARPLCGGFSQQALNRFFSERLLRERPDCVLIAGLRGCTLDLPRVARLMGVASVMLVDSGSEACLRALDPHTRTLLDSALADCSALVAMSAQVEPYWRESGLPAAQWLSLSRLSGELQHLPPLPPVDLSDYSLYEFSQRDHPLLLQMQRADTVHFSGCSRVLDLGCGAGVFLDCLRREGVDALGVERDSGIAAYARGMGLQVEEADALSYLGGVGSGSFDGIYCSHFVEHLPIDALKTLIEGVARALSDGGVAVFTFPDPESIRSQLFGFWRDPEHVRFYHPQLIESLAAGQGLALEWSSHRAQPHEIPAFTLDPAPLSAKTLVMGGQHLNAGAPASRWERLLGRLGLVSRGRQERFESAVKAWAGQVEHNCEELEERSRQLAERTQALWAINRTWAWDDNAALRFRKESSD